MEEQRAQLMALFADNFKAEEPTIASSTSLAFSLQQNPVFVRWNLNLF
jgi:hypothetical protein